MALKAGTVSDFSDSLAAAIEHALEVEWELVKGETLPADGQADRRLLFVAIAQGIVRYLSENDEASFDVHTVEVTQKTGNNITSRGTIGSQIIDVTQRSGDNRVQSSGTGIVNIKTTGTLH
jgi:hypothetical protein